MAFAARITSSGVPPPSESVVWTWTTPATRAYPSLGSAAHQLERPPEGDAQQGEPEDDEGGEEDEPPPPPLPEPHAATS